MKAKIYLFLMANLMMFASGLTQTNQPSVEAKAPAGESQQPLGKGKFFISPFYEFYHLQDLTMVKHTNYYSLKEGEFSDEYLQEDLDYYNDHFKTKYRVGVAGLRAGYQIINGLGISAFIGVSHFDFKSWVSDENTQSIATQYPAISFGGTVDLQKAIYKKLTIVAMVSYIYCNTGKPQVLTTAGDDVLSSHLQGQNWKVDAALAYRLGRFLPYVGAGFSQQFINTKVKVSILTTDENGYEYTNQTEFDSRFKSSVFYGFAGVEYKLNTGASVYLRGSFPNPLSATLGFRIVL